MIKKIKENFKIVRDCVQQTQIDVNNNGTAISVAKDNIIESNKAQLEMIERELITILNDNNNYNEVLSFSNINKQKELALKEKIKSDKKAKVIFIVSYSNKFGLDSIFENMQKSKTFEPFIFITHPMDKAFSGDNGEYLFNEALASKEYFEKKNYKTIFGYDENRVPIGLEMINPDIVFITDPNLYKMSYYNNKTINLNYLTCYLPYGIFVSPNFNARYNNSIINTSWKVFTETYGSYYAAKLNSTTKGLNYILAGYPKLDAYNKSEISNLPNGLDTSKKTVIYAPHCSILESGLNALNWSTFDIYFKLLLDLVKQYTDINFVFMPHPDLYYRLQELYKNNIACNVTPTAYLEYIKEWESQQNGFCFKDGEYIDLFKVSSCLITDCGSFIGEYLPSGKPCIYLFNPKKENSLDDYNDFAKMILDTYYICNNVEEMLKTFEGIVLYDADVQKPNREKICKNLFYKFGESGHYIVDYLTKILTE